jgi:hypothetical protein
LTRSDLHPHKEQQQYDADGTEPTGKFNVGNQAQYMRPENDAGNEVPYDLWLPHHLQGKAARQNDGDYRYNGRQGGV